MALLAHNTAGWEIRPHTRDDRGGIEQVFLRCLTEFPWRAPPEVELESLRYARNYSTVLVAEVPQAGIVGFIIAQTDSGYVSHLFVDEDWRFCGIACGLLKVTRTLSGKPLELDVDKQNAGAFSAYEALGWTVTAPHGRTRPGQWRLRGA